MINPAIAPAQPHKVYFKMQMESFIKKVKLPGAEEGP